MQVHTAACGCPGSPRAALRSSLGALLFLAVAPASFAGDRGPFGIDYLVTYDDSGIWNRKYQVVVEYGLIGAEVAGGLWFGGEDRLGRTFWKSIDASVAAGITAQLMKYAFSRVRPRDSGPGGDPNLWFKGNGNQSFPSGEVTSASSIVTPFVLEYGPDHPAVYALELLPIYDAIARVKVQAHWQSDVIAGFALGTTAGWLIHRSPNSPFILKVMPHAIYVGIGKSF
jgi:membrane-associated phospholipid phosphatase